MTRREKFKRLVSDIGEGPSQRKQIWLCSGMILLMFHLPVTNHIVRNFNIGVWIGLLVTFTLYEGIRSGQYWRTKAHRGSPGAQQVPRTVRGTLARAGRAAFIGPNPYQASARARLGKGAKMGHNEGLEEIESPVPILAKRIVKIDPNSLKLHSVFQGGFLKRVMRARCGNGPNIAQLAGHGKIPAVDCQCGFYAVAIDNDAANSYAAGGHLAEVELAGRIIECGHEKVVSRKVILVPRGPAAEKLGPKPFELEGPADLYIPQLDQLESPAFEAKMVEEKELEILGYRAQYQTILKVYVDKEVLSREIIGADSKWEMYLPHTVGGFDYPPEFIHYIENANPGIQFVWSDEENGPYKG